MRACNVSEPEIKRKTILPVYGKFDTGKIVVLEETVELTRVRQRFMVIPVYWAVAHEFQHTSSAPLCFWR